MEVFAGMSSTIQTEATVFVVDDDEPVRDSIALLLRSVGLRASTFANAGEFLDSHDPESRGCLVLDVRLPGMSGLDLQRELDKRGTDLPIVFITGHGDVPMAVRAMQSGAVDFLQKPFSDQDLLDRVQQAIAEQAERRAERESRAHITEKLAQLTPREAEVLHRVVKGEANKVIANRLELSQRTVEVHRAHIMRKLEVRSLAQLVRMVMAVGE